MTTPNPSPTTIGRYRITGTLGEGGMGTVYRAEQDQPSRTVALKVIRPDLVSPQLVRRFSRESEVLGRLQHPGIAQIYEAGTAEGPDGPQPFFAMELVSGVPLDEYAADAKLTVTQRLELFVRICEAVHYAHQKGIIHRDLKPTNIMVDAGGQPKVLDFGVARIADDETTQHTKQTTMGQLVGTLQYMSPEQVNADPLEIDLRSDVYSLGVILYQLLAERLPYDISRHVLHEAAWVILQVDPAPLSSVNRNLRGDVETIVGKALEKEKSRRYSSADELASDIRHYLKHEPISARPASAWYQVRKFAERNRALVGGLALAATILVIGTVVSIMLAVRATAAERLAESRRAEAEAAGTLAEERRAEAAAALLGADSARAVAQREQSAALASAVRASLEADKAISVNRLLQDVLISADPVWSRGEDLTVRQVLDAAAVNTARYNTATQPEVQAAVDASIGRTYLGLSLFTQARPRLDSAYAIRRRSLGPGSLDVAESANDLGDLARLSGDYDTAERRYQEAMTIWRRQLPADDDRITGMLPDMAFIRYSRGDHAGAERMYRETLRLTGQRHQKRGFEYAARTRDLGVFLVWNRRGVEAEPLLVAALAEARALYGDDYTFTLSVLSALADARALSGKYAAADTLYRASMATARKLFGNEHTAVANVELRAGENLMYMRRLEESDSLVRDGLAMRIRLLGEQHADVALARVNLARVMQSQQKFAEADSQLSIALAIRGAMLGERSPSVASTFFDLGYNAEQRGDFVTAERHFRAALPIWRERKLAREETNTLAALGWTLSKQNKLTEADSLLREALRRRRVEYGDASQAVGDTYEKLAGVALARGDLRQAESLTVAGLEIRKVVYGPRTPSVAGQLLNVAFMRERLNDSAGAIPVLREALAIHGTGRPPTDPVFVFNQLWLATDLCTVGQEQEGEALIRSAMPNVPVDTTRSMAWRLRVGLGYCLAKQGKPEEAEPLMLEGERRLRAIPNVQKEHLLAAVQRVAQLYRLWGNSAKEAEWRTRMP